MDVPEHLLKEIALGNVVAFVGAGFSAAANFPTWGGLLEAIVRDYPDLPPRDRDTILGLSESKNFQDLDMSAQLLSDLLTPTVFNEAIRAKLTVHDKASLPGQMKERLEYLLGIPFAAILTTNYDNILSGVDVQDEEIFHRAAFTLLREKESDIQRLEKIAFSKRGSSTTPVIKLHGDVERKGSVFVCTRDGYRRLLHGSSHYATFLRTLLATHTVLYIGFSFSDAYINELRSEIKSLFGSNGSTSEAPLAYAIMSGTSTLQQQALLRHDGLRIIEYDPEKGHTIAFNSCLRTIYEASNPVIKFGRLLNNRRLLWLHSNWATSQDTRYLKEYLESANAKAYGGVQTAVMTVVQSCNEALDAVLLAKYDCIICCYDTSADYSRGLDESEIGIETRQLVSRIRGAEACPILCFGYDTCVELRRSRLMRMGARCYTYRYFELLTELGTVLQFVD